MKTNYLEFEIEHQRITRTDTFFVVAGSKNYLKARFTFCDDWEGLTVTAIFSGKGGRYAQILENGECLVPWEVIQAPRFTVSAVGGDLITSNSAEVSVCGCGATTGDPSLEPTPTVYEQILEQIENGKLQGPQGEPGISPRIGNNGNWFVFDYEIGTYIDTGYPSTGSSNCHVHYVESPDLEGNYINLRDLESGTYILHGRFIGFQKDSSAKIVSFPYGFPSVIGRTDENTYLTCIYPPDNTMQYLKITAEGMTRKDAKLINMESKANLVTEITENSDDLHYPSAKAVYAKYNEVLQQIIATTPSAESAAETLQADTDGLLVDLAYNQTLMELGVV